MADKPLRVLLPRPARDQDRFIDLLENLELAGGKPEVLRWPVMALKRVEITDVGHFLRLLEGAHTVIFVSVPAVEAALELPGVRAILGDRPVLAVGSSTAAKLSEVGIAAEVPASANTEGLLALPLLQQVSGKHIVICRGNGGRETLAEILRRRGAAVEYLELYQREGLADYGEAINRALAENTIDLVVIHSGQVLSHLLTLIEERNREKLSRIPVLVPGPRVAEICSDSGLCHQVVAEDALPATMAAALVRWYTRAIL